MLGSSSLALQKGLSESLTGRFELLNVFHWNYTESQKGFGLDFEQYLAFGGYPGSYAYLKQPTRWRSFIHNSIVETVIGKDIMSIRSVTKPALFRQVFEIISRYPAQEVSYTKLLGQLQDKGNTDLIKHYMELYEGAFLFRNLFKYSAKPILKKSSSPKIIPLCPALYTVTEGIDAVRNPEKRGRIFELVVGAELARCCDQLYYWREGNEEVDYVALIEGKLLAVEVKSGRRKTASGLKAFTEKYPSSQPIIITPEIFPRFSANPRLFFSKLKPKN